MLTEVIIRRFQERDASPVRDLFIAINRQLSPPDMREVFESYIARSLAEEMDRVSAYYSERGGGFWVADRGGEIIGMFGFGKCGTRFVRASAHVCGARGPAWRSCIRRCCGLRRMNVVDRLCIRSNLAPPNCNLRRSDSIRRPDIGSFTRRPWPMRAIRRSGVVFDASISRKRCEAGSPIVGG
jgi:hypothetical protein